MAARPLVATAVAGLLLSILLVLVSYKGPSIVHQAYEKQLRKQLIWRPTSPRSVHERYTSNNGPGAPPDYVRFYLFNITNIEDVRAGEMPQLEEIGPFTYQKFYIKMDIWFDSEAHVAFKEYVYFVPVPELSSGDPNDTMITTLNIPLVGVLETLHATAAKSFQKWLDFLAAVIERWHDSQHFQGLFTTRSAQELLWGYEDALLAVLKQYLPSAVKSSTFQLVHNMTSPQQPLSLPPSIMNTGALNISLLGNIEADAGTREIRSWNHCTEVVQGTDATQFSPGRSAEDAVVVWVGDLYRSARLVVHEELRVEGVRLLRYWPDSAQGKPNPCHYQTIRGLMNITSPTAGGVDGPPGQPGPPLFLSLPHFCHTDPSLAEGVGGVACNESRHVTFLDVEPNTGATLRAAKRMMLSSQAASSGARLDPNVSPSRVVPIFWAEESSAATPAQLAMIRKSVYRALDLANGLKTWPLWAAGMVAAASAALLLLALLYPNEQHTEQHSHGLGDTLHDPLLPQGGAPPPGGPGTPPPAGDSDMQRPVTPQKKDDPPVPKSAAEWHREVGGAVESRPLDLGIGELGEAALLEAELEGARKQVPYVVVQ